jgi:carotenoid cleavage dioxygenase-like enzyme
MSASTGVLLVQGAVKTGGEVFVFERERATRFGVMPRNAKSGKEVRWYEMESMFAFHVANAWQEGPVIKLYAAISQEVCTRSSCPTVFFLSLSLPPFSLSPSLPLFFCV